VEFSKGRTTPRVSPHQEWRGLVQTTPQYAAIAVTPRHLLYSRSGLDHLNSYGRTHAGDGISGSGELRAELHRAGRPRESPSRGLRTVPVPADGVKVRLRPESFGDHYSQARLFYLSVTSQERWHIAQALTFELSKVDIPEIRLRMLRHLNPCIRGTKAKARTSLPSGREAAAAINCKLSAHNFGCRNGALTDRLVLLNHGL
jgi:hypothetical protein